VNKGAGPSNLITDVPGLSVGGAVDARARTGVTVILPEHRGVCAVDVRGGAPGTRETDALGADTLVEAVDAVVLSGGSVYGLAAADGVAAWLGAHGRGYGLARGPGIPLVPVVPSAILYDLANGGDKHWGLDPPYRALGVAAARAAGRAFDLGTAGAGAGAMAGALKGGLGSASAVTPDGFTVGALVAVNSFGAPWRPARSASELTTGGSRNAIRGSAPTPPLPVSRWTPFWIPPRRDVWRSWPRMAWPAPSGRCIRPSMAMSFSPSPPGVVLSRSPRPFR